MVIDFIEEAFLAKYKISLLLQIFCAKIKHKNNSQFTQITVTIECKPFIFIKNVKHGWLGV